MGERQKKVIDYLREYNSDKIDISFFKNHFNPADLVSQLEPLELCGLISIDWKNKIIISKLNIENSFKQKNKIKRTISEKPEYMAGEEIDINEPYI